MHKIGFPGMNLFRCDLKYSLMATIAMDIEYGKPSIETYNKLFDILKFNVLEYLNTRLYRVKLGNREKIASTTKSTTN